jgi:integrase
MQNGAIVRKGPSWYLRYREPSFENGEQRSHEVWKRLAPVDDRYKSKRDVEPLAKDTLASVNSATQVGAGQRLKDFIEWVYFPNIEKAPSTIHGYKHLFKKHLKDRLGDIRLFDFTTGKAQKLLRDIAQQTNLSHTSLRHIKHFLTGVFTFAKQESVIDHENPMRDVSVPKGEESEDTHAASLEEIIAMLEVLPEPAKTVVATAAFTGLRRSELRGLRWEDVGEAELNVRRSVWNTHIQERTKTPASSAPIPLVPALQKWLVAHRNGSSADGFVFAGPKMGRPLNLANLVRRSILPALEAARMKNPEIGVQWHGWHAFRRGLGTNLYRLGTPDKTIQAILRHSNVSTTLSFYVKPVAEDSQTAMQKLEKAFNNARKVARRASQQKAGNTA